MKVWGKGGVSSAESVGKVVSEVRRVWGRWCQRCRASEWGKVLSVVQRGGVRSAGRLMHEQVWKRSHCYSGSVTIISDFWQPFCVGKNNGGHKGMSRKTTFSRKKKRFLLDSSRAVKLFARPHRAVMV